MKLYVRAATAAAVCLIAMPASADDGARQSSVSYSDLDLTKQEGVAQLKRRVRSAVQTVCRTDDRALRAQLRERSCVKTSGASGMQEVARAAARATQAQAEAKVPGIIGRQ